MFARLRKNSLNITEKDPVFEVRYIGSTETFVASGVGCTHLPVQRIWDNSREERYLRKVRLIINSSGVTIKHHEGNTNNDEHFPIENISFCNADKAANNRIFCWISQVKGSRRLKCYAVLCRDPYEAREMAVLLSKHFQIAYIDWKANRNKAFRQRKQSLLEKQLSVDSQGNEDLEPESVKSTTEQSQNNRILEAELRNYITVLESNIGADLETETAKTARSEKQACDEDQRLERTASLKSYTPVSIETDIHDHTESLVSYDNLTMAASAISTTANAQINETTSSVKNGRGVMGMNKAASTTMDSSIDHAKTIVTGENTTQVDANSVDDLERNTTLYSTAESQKSNNLETTMDKYTEAGERWKDGHLTSETADFTKLDCSQVSGNLETETADFTKLDGSQVSGNLETETVTYSKEVASEEPELDALESNRLFDSLNNGDLDTETEANNTPAESTSNGYLEIHTATNTTPADSSTDKDLQIETHAISESTESNSDEDSDTDTTETTTPINLQNDSVFEIEIVEHVQDDSVFETEIVEHPTPGESQNGGDLGINTATHFTLAKSTCNDDVEISADNMKITDSKSDGENIIAIEWEMDKEQPSSREPNAEKHINIATSEHTAINIQDVLEDSNTNEHDSQVNERYDFEDYIEPEIGHEETFHGKNDQSDIPAEHQIVSTSTSDFNANQTSQVNAYVNLTSSSDVRVSPTSTSDVKVSPRSTHDVKESPSSTSDVNANPASTSDVNANPASTSDVNAKLTSTSDVNAQPTSTSGDKVNQTNTADVAFEHAFGCLAEMETIMVGSFNGLDKL